MGNMMEKKVEKADGKINTSGEIALSGRENFFRKTLGFWLLLVLSNIGG